MTLPRETCQACAEKAAKDFREAAELLPIDWDKSSVGRNTLGKNGFRINKITALAYEGKSLSVGSFSTGEELRCQDECKRQCQHLRLRYQLCTESCPRHLANSLLLLRQDRPSTSSWILLITRRPVLYLEQETCFLQVLPRIFSRDIPADAWQNSHFGVVTPSLAVRFCTGGQIFSTAYSQLRKLLWYEEWSSSSMTQDSGFDPTHPWKNRDPRFYHDIVYDGSKGGRGGSSNRMPTDMPT